MESTFRNISFEKWLYTINIKKEFWENGSVPWFRMDDIRENGQILGDSLQKISETAVKGGKLFRQFHHNFNIGYDWRTCINYCSIFSKSKVYQFKFER
jgi:hypothetical protein